MYSNLRQALLVLQVASWTVQKFLVPSIIAFDWHFCTSVNSSENISESWVGLRAISNKMVQNGLVSDRKTVFLENPPVQLKLIANFINSTILNEIRFYLRVLSVAHLQASTFPSGSWMFSAPRASLKSELASQFLALILYPWPWPFSWSSMQDFVHSL